MVGLEPGGLTSGFVMTFDLLIGGFSTVLVGVTVGSLLSTVVGFLMGIIVGIPGLKFLLFWRNLGFSLGCLIDFASGVTIVKVVARSLSVLLAGLADGELLGIMAGSSCPLSF